MASSEHFFWSRLSRHEVNWRTHVDEPLRYNPKPQRGDHDTKIEPSCFPLYHLTPGDDLLPEHLESRLLAFRPHDGRRDHRGGVLLQPECV